MNVHERVSRPIARRTVLARARPIRQTASPTYRAPTIRNRDPRDREVLPPKDQDRSRGQKRLNDVVELLKTGMTYPKVAERLSISRSAVAGIVLRARRRGMTIATGQAGRRDRVRLRSQREKRDAEKAKRWALRREQAELLDFPADDAHACALPFDQLGATHCRYTYDGVHYCGEPIASGGRSGETGVLSYCAAHLNRVMRPTQAMSQSDVEALVREVSR